jgi:hypothetical protein
LAQVGSAIIARDAGIFRQRLIQQQQSVWARERSGGSAGAEFVSARKQQPGLAQARSAVVVARDAGIFRQRLIQQQQSVWARECSSGSAGLKFIPARKWKPGLAQA